MKTARLAGVAALLSLASILSWSQDMSGIDGVKEMCGTFLESIISEDYEGAYGYLRSMDGIIDDSKLETIQQQNVEQSEAILNAYGSAIDYGLVDEKIVAGSLLRMLYVVRRETYIIRWKFIFYKARDTWKLASIAYDDKLDELF